MCRSLERACWRLSQSAMTRAGALRVGARTEAQRQREKTGCQGLSAQSPVAQPMTLNLPGRSGSALCREETGVWRPSPLPGRRGSLEGSADGLGPWAGLGKEQVGRLVQGD